MFVCVCVRVYICVCACVCVFSGVALRFDELASSAGVCVVAGASGVGDFLFDASAEAAIASAAAAKSAAGDCFVLLGSRLHFLSSVFLAFSQVFCLPRATLA